MACGGIQVGEQTDLYSVGRSTDCRAVLAASSNKVHIRQESAVRVSKFEQSVRDLLRESHVGKRSSSAGQHSILSR